MRSPYRFLVASDDSRDGFPIQSHLKRAIDLSSLVVRIEDVVSLISPETDGLILLSVLNPANADAAEAVIREIQVQKFPVRIGLLESEHVRNLRLLDQAAQYVSGRWVWPNQIPDLTAWARASFEPGLPFLDPSEESVTQRIRCRLINHTPSLTSLAEQIAVAAEQDVTVLIQGESGTGKSHIAKLIHDHSRRQPYRFMTVSCSAGRGDLIARELYGQAKGSLPGAEAAKTGKLFATENGTLLLDEIDLLTVEHQANLLRVIESGEYEPVGSHETQKTTARLIAATNWNLAEAVEQGTFRRDLYYRLHVINFHLLPLRQRPEDIAPLVRGMVARFGTKFRKRIYEVSPEALRLLESFPWPGNIRQLEHVMQQAVLSTSGNELRVSHIPTLAFTRTNHTGDIVALSSGSGGTLKQTRESSERANILRALEKSGQSRTEAAKLLGVSRVTLYKKMKKYGLFSESNSPFSSTSDSFPTISKLD